MSTIENTSHSLSNKFKRILIIGGQGAIGKAFVNHFLQLSDTMIITLSRVSRSSIKEQSSEFTHVRNPNFQEYFIDYLDETEIKNTIDVIVSKGKLDLIIQATGFLQNEEIKPEKSVKDISLKNLEHVFYVNTFLPALMIKHLLPHLNQNSLSIFAALSARVGSISDNNLGGWYSYRASKSALNMLIKSASIELKRINKNGIIVGLHPGTVESDLSKPFLQNKQSLRTFSPEQSILFLVKVLNQLTNIDSGKCIAWDGKLILP